MTNCEVSDTIPFDLVAILKFPGITACDTELSSAELNSWCLVGLVSHCRLGSGGSGMTKRDIPLFSFLFLKFWSLFYYGGFFSYSREIVQWIYISRGERLGMQHYHWMHNLPKEESFQREEQLSKIWLFYCLWSVSMCCPCPTYNETRELIPCRHILAFTFGFLLLYMLVNPCILTETSHLIWCFLKNFWPKCP